MQSFFRFFNVLPTKKAIFILIIFGFVLYGNALFNGFVWDDYPFIISNPAIHNINLITSFLSNTFNGGGYYRAIPALYFSTLYNLFTSNAFFYHFFEVCLHILNAVLVYLFFSSILNSPKEKDPEDTILKNLSGSQRIKYLRRLKENTAQIKPKYTHSIHSFICLFLALLFLVHPINVESVAYISASQSELFVLFGMLALLLTTKKNLSIKQLLLIFFLSALSLLTKETGILFLIMSVMYRILFVRKRVVTVLFIEIAALVVYCVIRFIVAGVSFVTLTTVPIAKVSLLIRLMNIPAILFYYITTIFFPLRLAIWQQWIIKKITIQNFYIPLLIDCIAASIVLFIGISFYRQKKSYFFIYLFFCFWFMLGIGMLLQIFPLDMTVADRWIYFPFIGLLGMVGIIIHAWFSSQGRFEKVKKIAVCAGIIIIVFLSLRTIIRNNDFHDEISLYSHDNQMQDSPELETYLGLDLAKTGNMHAALPYLQKAINNPYITPQDLYSIGHFYEIQGNFQKAKEYYMKATMVADVYYVPGESHNPLDQKIYIRLANILLTTNDFTTAQKISMKGLDYFSKSSVLWLELAISESKLHHWKEAIHAMQKAKNLAPHLSDDVVNAINMMTIVKMDIPSSNILQITSYISALIFN